MKNSKLPEENAKHLAVLNSEMGNVQKELEKHTEILNCHTEKLNKVEINVDWIKWIVTLMLGAIIIGMVTKLWSLF